MAEYWYETHAAAARLNRNLRLMLDQTSVYRRISVSDNTIRVAKVGPR